MPNIKSLNKAYGINKHRKGLGEAYREHHRDYCRTIRKMITYILDNEVGTSLKASGWKCVGKKWTGVRRPEVDIYPEQMKLKFEVE